MNMGSGFNHWNQFANPRCVRGSVPHGRRGEWRPDWIPAPESRPDYLYELGELRRHLSRAIASLDSRDQQILSLRYVEDLSLKNQPAVGNQRSPGWPDSPEISGTSSWPDTFPENGIIGRLFLAHRRFRLPRALSGAGER